MTCESCQLPAWSLASAASRRSAARGGQFGVLPPFSRSLAPTGSSSKLTITHPKPLEAASLDAKTTAPGISAEASPVCRKPDIVQSESDQAMVLKVCTPTIPFQRAKYRSPWTSSSYVPLSLVELRCGPNP